MEEFIEIKRSYNVDMLRITARTPELDLFLDYVECVMIE